MANKHLATYMNDHLAGSTVGLELAKRALGSNRGTQFETVLERLAKEIDEDREALREIMRALDVGEDTVKKIGAFVAEKVGRLKPNNALFSYSPLSRLVEFEGLALGVTGKLALWRALQRVEEPALGRFDIAALEARAEVQQTVIEEQRLEAVRIAFSS